MKRVMKRGVFTFNKPSLKALQQIKETGFAFLITNYQNIDTKFLLQTKKVGLEPWIEVSCFAGE